MSADGRCSRAYRWGYTRMRSDSRLQGFEAARYHPSEIGGSRFCAIATKASVASCSAMACRCAVSMLRPVGEAVFTVNHFYLHRALEIVAPAYYCISDISFFDERSNPFWHRNLMRLPTTTSFFFPSASAASANRAERS